MKTKLDGPYLAILAALGLELGCATRAVDDEGEDDVAAESTSATGQTTDAGSESSDSGESSESGESSDSGSEPYVCEDPQPIMQAGTDIPSGFVMCADGFVHRVEQVECVAPQGPDDPSCVDGFACYSAADCVEQPFGSCTLGSPLGGCLCHYGCASDADCDAGSVCACAGVIGEQATCIPADCTITEACGEGLCGLSEYAGCCDTSYALACAALDEACQVDADCSEFTCEGTLGVPYQCTAQSELGTLGPWTCQPPGWCGCDCGRPFLVAGHARVASVLAREDWCEGVEPSSVDAFTRRQLVAYWTQIGQLEHASIASFARACMQLIQLGAPAELIADSQRAMADEVRHARVAFGLASAYAGVAIGPGPLEVEGSLVRGAGLRAIVEGLVVEACVGETLAAIEVREAAQHARDPLVAALLDEIAADELRHARLGWRTLRWILDHADDDLRSVAWASFEAAMQGLASSSTTPARLREHGVLDDRLRDEVRRVGIESLIRPCLVALRQHYEDRSGSVSTS